MTARAHRLHPLSVNEVAAQSCAVAIVTMPQRERHAIHQR